MKPSVATCLSLVAVLGAGALAAAANLRVFADPAREASASAVGASPSSAVELDAPADAAQTFTLGPAGSLTLGTSGGLHVVGLDPAPGWQALPAQTGPPGPVVVEFRPPVGPGVVVTAVTGPDGIRVVTHEEPTAVGRLVDEHGGVEDD